MSEQAPVLIDRVGATSIFVAATSAPWELDVDALIVSVGAGLGQLALRLREEFPAFDWATLGGTPATVSRPVLLPPIRPAAFAIIAVTPHDDPPGADIGTGPATVHSARGATLAGLEAAADSGYRRVAMPLIGTGALRMSGQQVADAVLPDVRAHLGNGAIRGLDTIVVFDTADEIVGVAVDAWRHGFESASATVSTSLPDRIFSGTAQIVFDRAVELAGDRPDLVTPGQLWFAALENALHSARSDVAADALAELVRVTAAPDATAYLDTHRPVPVVSSSASGAPLQTPPLVARALAIAREVNSATARQRHLLAAAALTDDASLEACTGVTGAELRQVLRSAITAVLPLEFPDRWDTILARPAAGTRDSTDDEEESATELGGGIDVDVVDPDLRISVSEDRLGVATYVSMLASVIAQKDTPVPLSIGLFGPWGSGKSHFMSMLRSEIGVLQKRPEDGYLSAIEHIGFNAWHYTDTNLWASLGSEIFEQLAGVGDKPDERRDQLRAELGEKLELRRSLQQATEQAGRETLRLRGELDEARNDQRASLRDIAEAVKSSDAIKGDLDTAWKRLGVDDDVAKARLVLDEVRGVREDAHAVRRAGKGAGGIAVAVAAAVALVLFALAIVSSDVTRRWLTGAGLASVGLGMTVFLAVAARIRWGLNTVRGILTDAKSRSLAPPIAALADAVAHEHVLSTQLNEVVGRAGEIGRELADLAPGKRLYGFLSERATSNDYRANLGLVSTIRRDFQHLIALMKDWADHPEENKQPIERIVLYIDDLDRCTPAQVVDVLQAVHLLLALDLFVVVVGVDPRWLLHSLRAHYRDNLAAPEQDEGNDVDSAEPDTGWMASPVNYLEKIFNIPFVLPTMSPARFETLIRHLSRSKVDGDAASVASPARDDGARAQVPDVVVAGSDRSVPESDALAGVGAAAMPVETGSEVDAIRTGRRLRPRGLTEPEVDLLVKLGPLVQTPREAKRMLNLYRTLRTTRDLGSAADFLAAPGGGEFQAVCLLLGLLSARPSLVSELLWAPVTANAPGGLCLRDPTTPWDGVIEGLRPRATLDRFDNDLGLLTPGAAADWSWVVPRLSPVAEAMTLADIRPFQSWGPRISRFSFVLSPLANDLVDAH